MIFEEYIAETHEKSPWGARWVVMISAGEERLLSPVPTDWATCAQERRRALWSAGVVVRRG